MMVDCLFYFGLQSNLVSTQLVEKLGLEVQDHMLELILKDGQIKMEMRVIK